MEQVETTPGEVYVQGNRRWKVTAAPQGGGGAAAASQELAK